MVSESWHSSLTVAVIVSNQNRSLYFNLCFFLFIHVCVGVRKRQEESHREEQRHVCVSEDFSHPQNDGTLLGFNEPQSFHSCFYSGGKVHRDKRSYLLHATLQISTCMNSTFTSVCIFNGRFAKNMIFLLLFFVSHSFNASEKITVKYFYSNKLHSNLRNTNYGDITSLHL